MRTILFLLALASTATCADWDSSGNAMLSGTYYFREVVYVLGDQSGNLSRAIALYGNITFSGTGTYSISGAVDADTNSGRLAPFSGTGTYSIAASGYGFLSNPLESEILIYGLVSQNGVFVGSSTESGVNDMFVAAPLASPAPTISSFTGTWMCASFDLSSGSPSNAQSTLFQMTPNGSGSFGVQATAFFGGGGTSLYSQNTSGLNYIFSNGAAVATFPTNGTLLAGQKYLYFSKDGNFMFGGAPNAFDMIVAVRTGTGTPAFNGLYYEAGFDEVTGDLDSFYGALYANTGSMMGHERVQDLFYNPNTTDYTYSATFTLKSDGTFNTGAARYVVGAGGIRIGSGIGPYLGVSVGLPAPNPTGSGVFLSPVEIRNAASWSPFTESIAPGELLTLRGTNIGPDGLTVAQLTPFSTSLGGVQVSIGGLPAPIYYVSPTQISVIVPYGVTGPIVQLQVTYNGTPSNIVTTYLAASAPGVFTQDASGTGYAAILHGDYTKVTAASPAKPGESVAIYLTGLGAVSPPIADGAVGPSDTYSVVPLGSVLAYVGGVPATVGYAGLAPTLAGLYQVNITIPAGLTAGDNYLEITGPDAYTSSSLIPISTATSASITVAPRTMPRHRAMKRN